MNMIITGFCNHQQYCGVIMLILILIFVFVNIMTSLFPLIIVFNMKPNMEFIPAL